MSVDDEIQALRTLAARGSAQAQYEWARELWMGDRVPQDRATAVAWSRRAAEQGDPQYCAGCGLFLWEDGTSPELRSEGMRWIEFAAERGHVEAQYLLATLFASGDGPRRNASEAFHWYLRAAELGHLEAKYNAALMLITGEGVPRSFDRGVGLLEEAARGGEILALKALCEGYSLGAFSFSRDPERGGQWCMRYQQTLSQHGSTR